MSHSRLGLPCLIQRQKKNIDSLLELVKVIAIRKTDRGECIPQRCCSWEKAVHVVLWVISLNLEEIRMILLDPWRVPSTSSKRFAGRDHTAKLLRAFPVVVSVEKRKACNIASVGQGLQSWKQVVPNETSKTTLYFVQTGERSLGSPRPNVTAVFHPWTDLTFVEIENGGRGEIFPWPKEWAYHFTSFLGNRQNVGVPFEIRSEFETKESFEARCFFKDGVIHLNWTEGRATLLVMKSDKFGFRSIERDKPILAPLNYLLKIRRKIGCGCVIIYITGGTPIKRSVICIDVDKRVEDVVWKIIYKEQEQCGPKYGTLWDTSIDWMGLRWLTIDHYLQWSAREKRFDYRQDLSRYAITWMLA